MELLGSWILSIMRYSKKKLENKRFGNWVCFRSQM
jgi:hypothetical protein